MKVNNLDELDLDFIKERLHFFHNWPTKKILKVEENYRIFLMLESKFGPFRPNDDVDLFWHEHILCTEKYANDCNKFFNKFLHHTPTFNIKFLEDMSKKNYDLMKKEFPNFSEEKILEIIKLGEI